MCGRFTLTQSPEVVAKAFALKTLPELIPRYNIAPSQKVAVAIAPDGKQREMRWMQWGLIPAWAKDSKIGYKLINARSETIAEKPSFRQAFKSRRCLVLADGFYEWQGQEGSQGKQPYYIQMKDTQPFAFAGLWEQWRGEDDKPLQTCTIITTTANNLMEPIHNRMPTILGSVNYDRWLDPHSSPPLLLSLLIPYNSDAMTAFAVSNLVNSPQNERIDCIAPLE